ncbi:hypothetical protein K445DRAFT_25755 [Daldinia sp. EC12]|nr:hypothetical protein F4774DRAFT_428596 [Daldinia eschscholtzii]OTB12182.1 hypothetical protein K445DRAFT_25755 [Daldinia sp. EC12]
MKFFQTTVMLLSAAASSVVAHPTETELNTITSGDYTFVGVGEIPDIEKRCSGNLKPRADCQPGKCQCQNGYGCWSCNGGRVQCQPGPNSGVCWT